ncbi:hypothetical protein N9Y68_05325 [Luminiphilus sp.]|nr:hypothetical protein [Luminiphilus sp.]
MKLSELSIKRSKSIPLFVGLTLKFVTVLSISKSLEEDLAAQVFFWMSIASLLILSVYGRMATVKTRILSSDLLIEEAHSVYRNVLKRLVLALLIMVFAVVVLSTTQDMHLYSALTGVCYGSLLLFHNQSALRAELAKSAIFFYWLICFDFLLLTVFIYLGYPLEFLCFRLLLMAVSNRLWSASLSESAARLSFKNPLSRAEIATTVVGAFELPVIYLIGTSKDTVDFAILSRVYGAISTFYGQITRPYWAGGGSSAFVVAGKSVVLDMNSAWLFISLVVLLSVFLTGTFIFPFGSSFVVELFLAGFALFAVLNRHRKNFLLHKGLYEERADTIALAYCSYAVGLVILFLVGSSIEVLLSLKVALAVIVLMISWRSRVIL